MSSAIALKFTLACKVPTGSVAISTSITWHTFVRVRSREKGGGVYVLFVSQLVQVVDGPGS
jgi:hypothetical protein